MRQIQQGDVLLRQIEILPDNLEKKEDGVLAEGEASGHFHRIRNTVAAVIYLRGLAMYMQVKKGQEAIIEHEEHKPVTVQEGCYLVQKVREWDPFEQETREVTD